MAKKRHARKPRSGIRNWSEIVRENKIWEDYYKSLNLFPIEEWEDFKKACQEPLPLTFRINESISEKYSNEILNLFEKDHLKYLTNIEFEGIPIKRPSKLKWYPRSMAWQIDVPKRVMRKNEMFKKTQRFLVLETNAGNISRQEAVSMVPPLLMDIQSNHKILDMCAAPGSKTAQLVEALHLNCENNKQPTGFIIANDSDTRRSHMLVHQLKRLKSSNYLILNHDAQFFPRIKINKENNSNILKFDRILCDVPCSGDGTLRKNINVWMDWKHQNGLGLHALQFNILNRGIELLENGGRLVYSTCSLNPIEDEAVVAQALRKWGKEKLTLIDCSNKLPDLKRCSGISYWPVIDKNLKEKTKTDDNVIDSWFPPNEEEKNSFHLDRCIRILPHQQNTGGFFVAVFEKAKVETDTKSPDIVETLKSTHISSPMNTSDLPPDKIKKESLPLDAMDEPFNFIDTSIGPLSECWKFFGFNETFNKDNCLVRSNSIELPKVIYSVNPQLKNIIELNREKLKMIYSGVKLFVYQRDDIECAFRIHSEAIPLIKPYVNHNRIIDIDLNFLKLLLTESFPTFEMLLENNVESNVINQIEKFVPGCAMVYVSRDSENKESILLPIWKGIKSINIMVSKEDAHELLYRVFGIETQAKDNPKARKPLEETEKLVV
ncbi:similar to Saccharomyces cerevisiae YBL024W NCL1 S-adenosyl-L-methionine-dependent tRNA: m5C-methyltransferase [Maudiozyma saulgeensis]|uniref:Similar to Saccharomyces cerevisiae YBL024W NCL1 S-adenosyl-L-methionine-dependent tRNA: m5C-methyltransferase n=1 Tax=Maudiozyma saulgeensis TaxID=1789683 RepID=A0A1X7QYL2_9SACH|nr:similar to Saccharomyces cerevisiae YBL024W NCL1 S-adenosyl-L-methionine-dependent tRNA: m5C-methyltransferase [Kazachstania saulgeensis]